jgi:hypothetical protein
MTTARMKTEERKRRTTRVVRKKKRKGVMRKMTMKAKIWREMILMEK